MLAGVLVAVLGLIGCSVAAGGMIVEQANLAPAPYPDWAHYVSGILSNSTCSHSRSTGCGMRTVATDQR